MAVVASSRIAANAGRGPGTARSLPISPGMGVSPPAASAGSRGMAARPAASVVRKVRRCMGWPDAAGSGGGTGGARAPPVTSFLHEAQGHAVAFADGLVFSAIDFGVVVGRRQGPHAIRMVLAVARVGVDLAAGIQAEARGLGQGD